jgi:hypothetical protein
VTDQPLTTFLSPIKNRFSFDHYITETAKGRMPFAVSVIKAGTSQFETYYDMTVVTGSLGE